MKTWHKVVLVLAFAGACMYGTKRWIDGDIATSNGR